MSDNQNSKEAASEARDFLQVLGDMPNTVIDLTDKFQALLDGIRDTGKKGSIQLTIGVEPEKNDDSIKKFSPVVKVTIPQMPLKPVIMFDQPDGTVARSNPAVSLFDMPDDTPIRAPRAQQTETIKEARS
jgi:hypothetical protein